MAGRLQWDGDKVRAQIHAEMARRVRACCILVSNEAKKLVSVAGTGVGRHKSSGKFKTLYGANPSATGEPPHKQTGRLRGSITHEVLPNLVGRVGTNLLYGRIQELGSRKQKARPWLRPALRNCMEKIKAILGAPMK